MPSHINLPRLQSVKITNFRLYSGIPEVIVNFTKPVTCLAGANGLGKSTFLNILCFALTGCVRDAHYTFVSVRDLADKKFASFSYDYFEGRYGIGGKPPASVELIFSLGSVSIRVKRNFSKQDSFIEWQIVGTKSKPSRDESEYQKRVSDLAGLSNFAQFIFLVHYILLFDENHVLLLWNTDLVTATFHLLLGIDTKTAAKADDLVKKIKRLQTALNHTSWEIKKQKDYIEQLKTDMNKDEANEGEIKHVNEMDDIDEEKYKQMILEAQELEKRIEDNQIQLNTNKAFLADLSARRMSLRNDYDSFFERLLGIGNKKRVTNHQIIRLILENGKCNICNQTHNDNIQNVSRLIKENICPLCRNPIPTKESSSEIAEISEKLKSIDQELVSIEKNIEDLRNLCKEKEEEVSSLKDHLLTLQKELNEIDQRMLLKSVATQEKGDSVIRMNEERLRELMIRKEKYERERTKTRKEAQQLRESLHAKFNQTKKEFLPIFSNLAKKFTGLDITIQLKDITHYYNPEIKVILEIGETGRHHEHQLSESQRYFIDIALRMAFIIHTSQNGGGGMLLLDTPEGSLDIAYETNAGEMLAEFAKSNQQMIMTANVNSSGLLVSLARECGSQNINFIRMLDWAPLTTVQVGKKSMFDEILNKLENNEA